jgi:hypothetical protein
MAGKAAPQDVVDEGFRPEQFGAVQGWLSDYLPAVLLAAELWARDALGDAAYDAADPNAATVALKYAASQIKRAEVYHASATLWRRRAKVVDSNAVAGLNGFEAANRSRYFEDADSAEALARDCLAVAAARMGVTIADNAPGSGLSVGHVESGRFPPTSTTAVTA